MKMGAKLWKSPCNPNFSFGKTFALDDQTYTIKFDGMTDQESQPL